MSYGDKTEQKQSLVVQTSGAELQALRNAERPRLRWLAFAALSGAGIAAGQAPLNLWALAMPCLALVIWQAGIATGARRAAAVMWAAGTGYFAGAMFWIVEPFMVDAASDGWMAPFALVMLSTGLALFWALAGGGAALIGGNRQGRRTLALAVTLAIAELTRSYILTGLPWALIGHIWIGTPLMQLATLIGPVGLTLLTTLAAALPVALARRSPLAALFGGTCSAALLGIAALWGQSQIALPIQPRDPPVIVRLVQPDAPQNEKWREDRAAFFVERQLAFTGATATPKPDVIIWPETAVPYLLENSGPVLSLIARAAQGAPVILGINRGEGARYYNSLIVVGRQGEVSDIYDKHHLVPFGEYIPFGGLLARLGLTGFAASDGDGFSPGPGPQVLRLGPLGNVLPLICYEAVFPQDLRAAERPDWLVQITNDAWFGALSGPYQHLAQARLRAVEQGLPLVRVANTGISAMIDARGQITRSLPLNIAGYVDALLPPSLSPTLYSRTGDLPMAVLLGILGLGLLVTRPRITG